MPRSTRDKLAQLTVSEKKNRENAQAFAEKMRGRRWETFPERLLRMIDEGMPKVEVRDAVSAEVLRCRPGRKDAHALYEAICKRMCRARRLRNEGGHERAAARIDDEIYLLEWALAETMEDIGEEEEYGCNDEN